MPNALASEGREYCGNVWRVVEAQHRISTNRLAGSLEEQARLEALADLVKPDLPKAAGGLHYLLSSPFRYGYGCASRFRRASVRPGIFYASESEATAIAETVYWRLRFYSRSPGFIPPSATSEHTSFTASIATSGALDLTSEPFCERLDAWTDPVDYTACQDLAAAAREAGLALIRSVSARDPRHGCNVVVLDPAAFCSPQPSSMRAWHFRVEQGRLSALAAFPLRDHFVFHAVDFGLP